MRLRPTLIISNTMHLERSQRVRCHGVRAFTNTVPVAMVIVSVLEDLFEEFIDD